MMKKQNRQATYRAKVNRALPAVICDAAMENGLICYPGGGTANGVDGARILLAPPFIYQPQHINEWVTKLLKTMRQVSFV